ncbi:hypothetical protein K474DRAFT_1654972 [Panus rudis PR-1116 ss-1]|nr:hypothetical protein K474DRAFT_1654972 [Panus rudis PR-1116 ss-1]
MSLRRFAQANNAVLGSPKVGDSSAHGSPTTPIKNGGGGQVPITPRTRLVYPASPLTDPSLSASTPFDWEAARTRKPPPYASPLGGKRVRAARNGVASPNRVGPARRVVRRKGFFEKIASIPSQIAFEISIFPHNIPLPTPQKAAWILGGFCHFLHLCVRFSQIRSVPESDTGWEDMYREDENESWFDWTVPVSFLLVAASILNTMSLFTRTKNYQLNLARDPVSSPHAKFVPRTDTTTPPPSPPPLYISALKYFWRAFLISIRFLFNMSQKKSGEVNYGSRVERVQQLEVWNPGELEMHFFAVYSPVHALLWMATNGSNWMLMMFVMVLTGAQLRALTKSYEALLKDKTIIAAEMLHEYDEKFVYPRINPIRKDAAVMTHQAEMVNIWDGDRHQRKHHHQGV